MAKNKFFRACIEGTNLFAVADETPIDFEEEASAARDSAIKAFMPPLSRPVSGNGTQTTADPSQPAEESKPANDNKAAADPEVDAALTRIAEAIGRHIARQHIRAHKAANDNDGQETI